MFVLKLRNFPFSNSSISNNFSILSKLSAFKYSIFSFSLTNHFFRLIKRKLKCSKKKRKKRKRKKTISYKIRNKSITSKMFIVSNFSSTVNPFSMIMERWTSSFELTRNNYEIIRGYHGVNEFITRNHGVLCDLCRIRFTELLEKEEREKRKREGKREKERETMGLASIRVVLCSRSVQLPSGRTVN